MIKSSKPRMQKSFRRQAPLHLRRKFLNAHIDKKLKEKMKIERRSVVVVEGDTVMVKDGSHKGKEGKVVLLDSKRGRVAIDSIARKSARGKESHPLISASSVYITELNLMDKRRAAKLKVKAALPERKEAAKGAGKEKEIIDVEAKAAEEGASAEVE